MGERLLLFYKYIYEQKGMEGKVKLAQLTKVPSPMAAIEPDSQEKIETFKKAIVEITGKPAPDL
jgi:hypothetical protein